MRQVVQKIKAAAYRSKETVIAGSTSFFALSGLTRRSCSAEFGPRRRRLLVRALSPRSRVLALNVDDADCP